MSSLFLKISLCSSHDPNFYTVPDILSRPKVQKRHSIKNNTQFINILALRP